MRYSYFLSYQLQQRGSMASYKLVFCSADMKNKH